MNLSFDNQHFPDWRSSFEDHPQLSVLKCHVERAVQDLFLEALRGQSQEFIYIFASKEQISDFCKKMCIYWENEESYEICGEILSLENELLSKWKMVPDSDRGKEMVIREWLKSSF